METTTMNSFKEKFATDVDQGLSSNPKTLPSRYFYDARGDKLFQDIMRMPEYYLTDCEYEILNLQKNDILQAVQKDRKFNLVELGAGDGYKTKLLLQHFLEQGVDFEYFPVDISHDVLLELENSLKKQFPTLKVTPLNYEYFEALERLNDLDHSPKVILFLGSNIGNFSPERAHSFFAKLNHTMQAGDALLSGIDLKKDPRTILMAYNDPTGITKAFNMNLLHRMNRELGANFVVENFDHYPTYDPFTGEARSYLMSTVDQEVYIATLDKTFSFAHSEPVHTEISRKYSLNEINELASQAGFNVQKHFTDSKGYFVDTLWRK
ncbi:MAG TPA: L-histidine N(alpha)-methyltransferase [Cryomorphaceae bacterium]|nr:L-histidine N(alpha)-methyltransferase [Owenweeksia sp.]MBF97531.1 L-histidine N(alpha)-methyltransferase [Owenweeksia sp.]HAD96082.1 L-histidine N(alpha)-methyltransferase [Cryomorphaceae bacterium]HBF20007.1 L-histidine N(alpha)-methyltransferase [Cryomorphaceae bacterium]